MPNLVDEYKTIFLGKRGKSWNFQKPSAYKFVLKPVKILNRILWATEYRFKALKCHFWLTNTKPVFWESETNVQTLQKRSPYIGVSYKFILKSVKSLNQTLWVTESWFKALECQIWLTITKPFFWENEKRGKRWNFSKTFCLYLGFLYVCFEVWGSI